MRRPYKEKKRREPRKGLSLFEGDDVEAQRRASQTGDHRRVKAERAAFFNPAKPCTDRQWAFLAHELGTTYPPFIHRFVEWANGWPSGSTTLDPPPPWPDPRRPHFLSRRDFVAAINLARLGRHGETTVTGLLAQDFGTDEASLIGEALDLFDAQLPPILQTGRRET